MWTNERERGDRCTNPREPRRECDNWISSCICVFREHCISFAHVHQHEEKHSHRSARHSSRWERTLRWARPVKIDDWLDCRDWTVERVRRWSMSCVGERCPQPVDTEEEEEGGEGTKGEGERRTSWDCVWSRRWMDWLERRSGRTRLFWLRLMNSSCVQLISRRESSRSVSSSRSESFRANSLSFSTTATRSSAWRGRAMGGPGNDGNTAGRRYPSSTCSFRSTGKEKRITAQSPIGRSTWRFVRMLNRFEVLSQSVEIVFLLRHLIGEEMIRCTTNSFSILVFVIFIVFIIVFVFVFVIGFLRNGLLNRLRRKNRWGDCLCLLLSIVLVHRRRRVRRSTWFPCFIQIFLHL